MANRQIGKELAAWTKATIKGSGFSLVISQPEAALYIHPPTFETNVAVQITANAVWRNGAANEEVSVEFGLPVLTPSPRPRKGERNTKGPISMGDRYPHR